LPAGPDTCLMSFCIESTRDVSVLVRQLERLHDVRDVFLLPAETAARSGVELHAAQNFQASWLAG
jgi:acetolactate synthase regulatory subunit